MADGKINMPGPFGGIMRYNEEYTSRFMLSPAHVLGFVLAIVLFVMALKIFWPIVSSVATTG